MRLDRYIGDKTGKYSIIEHRNGDRVVHVGDPVDDFVVIKLKDMYAGEALRGYANAALKNGDHELAVDMLRLANEADHHMHRRKPD